MLFSTDMKTLQLINAKAAVFCMRPDIADLPAGRYDLDDGEYVNVSEYETKPREQGVYEAHQRYIDIQVVLEGAELIEILPTLVLGLPYEASDADDYGLYSGTMRGETFALVPGRFIVATPEDGHMPGLAVAQTARVKKAVFKVPVGSRDCYLG